MICSQAKDVITERKSMKILTAQQIIKDHNYQKQKNASTVFFVAGLFFAAVFLLPRNGFDVNYTINVAFTVFVIVIPFVYNLGLKRMLKASRKIQMLKKHRFTIVESKIYDTFSGSAEESDRSYQLIYGENESVWVTQKVAKNFAAGDSCYLILLEGDDTQCGIYNQKKVDLSPELLALRRTGKP